MMKVSSPCLSTRHLTTTRTPKGCDTFVALPPATAPGTTIFGKNSDRPCGEGQSIRYYSADDHDKDDDDSCRIVQCTYIAIPQVAHTYAVLLSQIDWMWGAEMGANEWGVVIGNEAVWTTEQSDDDDDDEPLALLGMDLVRLGLERAQTTKQALDVMTDLLETHGQGGPCAENDPSFTYHNSFLIADAQQHAIVLETAGKHWVAQTVKQGTRNISNGLTIRTEFDHYSAGLHDHAQQRYGWNPQRHGPLDWAATFSVDKSLEADSPYSRQSRGCQLLLERTTTTTTTTTNDNDKPYYMTAERMMDILRDHKGGICMHGPGFETTASMVSELKTSTSSSSSTTVQCRHWMTGKALPCQSPFVEQVDAFRCNESSKKKEKHKEETK